MSLYINHHLALEKAIESLHYENKPTVNKKHARVITLEFITYLITNKNSPVAAYNHNGLHHQLTRAARKILGNESITEGECQNITRQINNLRKWFLKYDQYFYKAAMSNIARYLIIDLTSKYSTQMMEDLTDTLPDELLSRTIVQITLMIEWSDSELNGNPWRNMRNALSEIINNRQECA